MLRTASAVIDVAIKELGYMEKASNSQLDSAKLNAGSSNYTKYARDFDTKYPNWYNGKKNGHAWCDMFVDWCFLTAFGYVDALFLLCQPEHSSGAGCKYSAGYYQKKGQLYTSNPLPGDQIFFGSSLANCNHTGIVEKVAPPYIYTIEGNTSNQVARRKYKLSDPSIVGYGRPQYDKEGDSSSASSSDEFTYTVKAGDTLAKIASSYGVPYKKIAECNGIANPNLIRIGQKLNIPMREWVPNIGDVVNFIGEVHYTNANAVTGVACRPGKAKITNVYSHSSKHPYHLIATIDGGSTVHGWVSRDEFTKG